MLDHALPPTRFQAVSSPLIDGDHSHDGCYADLHNYAHMAKRILVHNTEEDTEVEVGPAVKDYRATVNREVIWHHGNRGMAEIGEPFKLCEECRCNRAEPGQRICYSCRSSC
jgi:hypothetical protein